MQMTPAQRQRAAIVARELEEAYVKGECFFIEDNSDQWQWTTFYFTRRHVLKFLTFDGWDARVISPDRYNIDHMHVGSDIDAAIEEGDWEPTNQTPDLVGDRCIFDTLMVFPSKTAGEPALWLQFPTIHDFCDFYRYWNMNVRRVQVHTELWQSSLRWYESLAMRIPPRQPNRRF